jgi:hypothetical protein
LPTAFVLNVGPFALPALHLPSLVQTQQDVLPQLPCVKLLHAFSNAAPELDLQNASEMSDKIGISNPSFKCKYIFKKDIIERNKNIKAIFR